LARDRRQAGLSRLGLHDLLRLSAIDEPPAWRCKACRGDFSITSGTLFAWHKLPLRTYLLAVAAFCNEVKGIVSRRRASVMLYER
jgi:hypothetical protein